jgi:glycosyltransferase involved in cell wall biosynthesis
VGELALVSWAEPGGDGGHTGAIRRIEAARLCQCRPVAGGVDTTLFRPRDVDLCLPQPVFLCVGRVAVEKNLAAFLALDLPGTKVVVGDGPARAELERDYPDAVFLGALHGEALAKVYAAADVFVFPSRTDTFGLVLLEALASGLPVAAFPVAGPRDVIGATEVGVLDEDLRSACLGALTIAREDCVAFAANHTWDASTRAFIDHMAILPIPPVESEPVDMLAGQPSCVA